MAMQNIDPRRLPTLAAKWRSALADAATGPLAVAGEVVRMAEDWESYKVEAEGLTASQWLANTFGQGKGLPWFNRRHEAVQRLGEACRRTWHHEAAVWVAENVRDDVSLRRLKDAAHDAYVENGRNPLTLGQIHTVAAKVLGHKPAFREYQCHKPGCGEARKRIAQLEAAMRAAGVDVPK
jgi:hypothetical protein